jgi:hypothetical protein
MLNEVLNALQFKVISKLDFEKGFQIENYDYRIIYLPNITGIPYSIFHKKFRVFLSQPNIRFSFIGPMWLKNTCIFKELFLFKLIYFYEKGQYFVLKSLVKHNIKSIINSNKIIFLRGTNFYLFSSQKLYVIEKCFTTSEIDKYNNGDYNKCRYNNKYRFYIIYENGILMNDFATKLTPESKETFEIDNYYPKGSGSYAPPRFTVSYTIHEDLTNLIRKKISSNVEWHRSKYKQSKNLKFLEKNHLKNYM